MTELNFTDESFQIKYLQSELSPDSAKQFEKWLAENPVAALDFKKNKQIWLLSSQITLKQGIDSNRRWQRLEPQLITNEKSIKLKNGYIYLTAAIILIAFSVSLFFNNQLTVISSAHGEHKVLYLPDSSKVTLNAGSQVSYSSNRWQTERLVELKGEAFFEVKKGKRFTVKTLFSQTEVLGTSFNIREIINSVVVACTSGRVEVTNRLINNHSVVLLPGLASRIDTDQKASIPYLFNQSRLIAWLDNQFYFEQELLSNVFKEIERQYNIQIEFANPAKSMRFTGKFAKNRISETLEIICLSSGLSFEQNELGVYQIN